MINRSETVQQGYRVPLFVLVFLILSASSTFFRIRDYTNKTVDLQTALKLAGIAITLLLPLGAMIAGRLTVSTPLKLVWAAFLVTIVLCSFGSPQVSVSLSGSIALLGCFLFCIWMAERFGEIDTISLIITSVGILSLLSLVVYFANPELGRMHAWLGNEFGANNRIRGIVGSANGLGSMTSMALICTVLYFKRMGPIARGLVLVSAPFASICLIMSNNRMSMLALVVCVLIWLSAKGNKALNLILMFIAVGALTLIALSAPDLILSAVSRSGDIQEVTSGTGRAQIWSVVLELIWQKPFLGHGYASATSILPLDPRLFSVAAHTHNMYLELLFSGGFVSFLLFLAAMILTLYQGFQYRCFEPLILLFFFLFRGLTEPTPFSGPPSIGGYIFFLSAAFISLRSQHAKFFAKSALAEESASRLARYRAHLQHIPGISENSSKHERSVHGV